MEKSFWIKLALLITCAIFVPALAADSPMAAVKESNREVTAYFAGHDELDAAGEKFLFSILEKHTDFAAMSRSVIEPYCHRITPAQCGELKDTFRELLKVSSLKKLGRYRADRFEYRDQILDKDEATVRTLAFYEGEGVEMDYRLALRGQRWVIINYTVDGVDTMRNYRKQFLKLFNRFDYPEILARLQRKIEQYRTEY